MVLCKNCGSSLFPFFGGIRCQICNDLFCEKCIIKKHSQSHTNKICLYCFTVMEISQEENLSANYQEELQKNLPDRETVFPIKFSNLSMQALYPSYENPENDYTLISEIGRGGFGKVFKVKEIKTGELYASKVITLEYEEDKEMVRNEFALTKLSSHENIITYHFLYESESEIWIIQELMEFSLNDILLKDDPIPEKYALYILKEVLNGLKFIHSNFRIHRDIKSDNILMTFDGAIKICDLGLAAQLTSDSHTRSTFAGSPCWLAPEIFDSRPYDMKVDIWGFGMLCIELIDGVPPMHRNPLSKIKKYIFSTKFKLKNESVVSEEYSQIINNCLEVEPEKRISAIELLNLPIFKSLQKPPDFSDFLSHRFHSLNSNNI